MKKKFLFLLSPNLMPFKKSQFLSSWFLFLFLPINQLKWTSEAMGRAVDHSVIDDVDSHTGLVTFMTKVHKSSNFPLLYRNQEKKIEFCYFFPTIM